MTTIARSRLQLFGAWCGIFYVVAVILGWAVIAGFIPPHLPSAVADTIDDVFRTDFLRIRVGMIIVMVAALIVMPFSAVLSQFLSRIEGGPGLLAYSALLGGAGTMILTFYPAIWWLVAAYRPDRPADLVYLMNDMAWLQFIGGASIYWAMPLSVIIAAFCDDSEFPVFPRWAGYANLWLLLIMLPDQLLFFFHAGPFAWNGLFGLWIPLAGFASWFILVFFLLRCAILREQVGRLGAAAIAGQSALTTTAAPGP